LISDGIRVFRKATYPVLKIRIISHRLLILFSISWTHSGSFGYEAKEYIMQSTWYFPCSAFGPRACKLSWISWSRSGTFPSAINTNKIFSGEVVDRNTDCLVSRTGERTIGPDALDAVLAIKEEYAIIKMARNSRSSSLPRFDGIPNLAIIVLSLIQLCNGNLMTDPGRECEYKSLI
jgi:hypothetical protein